MGRDFKYEELWPPSRVVVVGTGDWCHSDYSAPSKTSALCNSSHYDQSDLNIKCQSTNTSKWRRVKLFRGSAGDSGSACLMVGTGGEFPTKGFPVMTQRNGRVGRGHVCYMLRFGPQLTG
ncbi:hypothetical protein RRG08_000832 [Elysia crispata]|uniref:Uncharacterized protein n=1 Tax=Elysia crispata TaxID=231223 RepID=A0AAE0XUW2_9GAST|nr:hypothetical protein RRG08_000832 [Elysia crispata]